MSGNPEVAFDFPQFAVHGDDGIFVDGCVCSIVHFHELQWKRRLDRYAQHLLVLRSERCGVNEPILVALGSTPFGGVFAQ